MASLGITLKSTKIKKIVVELDADKFERVAASLGLFSDDFLNSLDRSEKNYQSGKVTKIKSLKDLEPSRS